MEPQLKNVLLLGSAFHLIFFAYHTSVFIQQTVVNSIKNRPEFNFTGDGYISLCITYAVFSLANWLAPSMIAVTGLKYGMFCAALVYAAYTASFLYPTTLLFYTAAALIGLSAGLLWTAQGGYLASLSNPGNSSRNANLFWCMLQSCMLFGNLFVYFAFRHQTTIDDRTRYIVYGVLATIGTLGAFVLLLIRSDSSNQSDLGPPVSAVGQFMEAVKLARTEDMLIFSIVSLYTGLLQSFFTGVYGTAIGATPQFGSDAKRYIGLSGIFVGFGEMLAGGIFGLRAKKVSRRDIIFYMGAFLSLVAFTLTYLSLPLDSSLKPLAMEEPIIEPRVWIVILISIMLGFSDACFNTQVYSFLMSSYQSNQSIGAFALFKFVQSLGSALAFFYSTVLNLHHQLYILILVTFLASMSFSVVERRCQRRLSLPSRIRNYDYDTRVEHKF